MSTRPTLAQVARRAGVSTASVSRALNGGSASRETIERVREAVRYLGYVPDATARLLKLGHWPAIAFAVPDIGNPVYVDMVKAMEQVTRRDGFRLSLTSCGSDPDEIATLVRSMDRGFADGLVITPLRVTPELAEALVAVQVPVVVIGRVPDDVPLDTVAVDSAAGVELAVDHLVVMGHRSVALLNGPTAPPGRARHAGYLRAAERHGFEPTVVAAADFTMEAAEAALAQWLEDNDWPSAILATNDLMAVGVMRRAVVDGVRVGPDLAVVGMDDTLLTDLVQPSLTSVSLGAERRAAHAVELLIGRITKPGRAHQRVTVQPTLVVRESTLRRKEAAA